MHEIAQTLILLVQHVKQVVMLHVVNQFVIVLLKWDEYHMIYFKKELK